MPIEEQAVQDHLPLHPRVLLILCALLDGPLVGTAIAERAGQLSDGAVQIGPATLYRTLDRLVTGNLVRELVAEADGTPGRPGAPMELTQLGRAVVGAEFARLEGLGRVLGLGQ